MILPFLLLAAAAAASASAGFTPPKHAEGVHVADFARHDLPPVLLGGRVIDLMSGTHFDNLLQDTPDELRPPSLILFHGYQSCPNAALDLQWHVASETKLPSRERVLLAQYDMDASPVRAWFKFTPEMDLARRMNVSRCGTLVFVPRGSACDGFTQWCEHKEPVPGSDGLLRQVGCETFKSTCNTYQHWNEKEEGNWVAWANKLIKQEGEPEISPVLGSYADQNAWLRARDETTNDNEMRNYFLVEGFPAFTQRGFLAMPTPPEVQDFFIKFWNRKKLRQRRWEQWHAGSTQMSFHDTPTTFIALDEDAAARDELANRVLKPIVEEWSNMRPLELTSFYGIREYKKDSWLRGHIDRIDTHVLSITFVVGKTNASEINHMLTRAEADALPKWPLEVYAYDGNVYRHEHPPGTMILYESSKLIHGRPYKNAGPDHLGAFAHFKPMNKDADEALAWDKIAAYARRNQAKNTKRVPYRTSAIKEPTMPRFSQQRYGEGTGIQSSKQQQQGGRAAKQQRQQAYVVEFKNESNRVIAIAWISPEGDFVEQGKLGAGASLKVETTLGHKFVWLDARSAQPLPQGKFEIEAGSRTYVYSTKS